MPKGRGRRGQSQQLDLPWVAARLGWCCFMSWARQCNRDGVQASGDHGRHLLLPGVPAHGPAHLQVIHQQGRHQLGQEWPQGIHHTHAKCAAQPPLPGAAWDCSRLQGRLAESGQEHNGATRKGKNQKCEIKQGSVGIPREKRPLSEVCDGQTALESEFRDVQLSGGCSLTRRQFWPCWAQCHHKGKFPVAKGAPCPEGCEGALPCSSSSSSSGTGWCPAAANSTMQHCLSLPEQHQCQCVQTPEGRVQRWWNQDLFSAPRTGQEAMGTNPNTGGAV